MFQDLDGHSRVNWKNANIAPSELKDITTLIHLKECVSQYVKNMKKHQGSFEWESDSIRFPFDRQRMS